MSANDQTITINDIPYIMADLSEEAKNQLLNLRVTDQEIERLKQRMAIAQTARKAYARALDGALPPRSTKASLQ